MYLKKYIDYCQEQGLVLRLVIWGYIIESCINQYTACVKFANELQSRPHIIRK